VLQKPLEILGDNSLADSAIGFLQGENVSPVSFLDFIKFWDAYVIYDSFYVEELPQRDVHKSQADFLESHENVRHFLKDLKYTDDERIERWEYAESSLTKQNFANFLSKEGLPKSLSTLKCLAWERRDEDSALNYLNARYSYSNEEVKRKVLRAVKKAILKKQPSQEKRELKLLLPHLIRSYMNAYSQIKLGIEARYITLREVLVDQTGQYANNLGLFGNPRHLTRRIGTRTADEVIAATEEMTEIEKKLEGLSASCHPVYLALDKASSADHPREEFIAQLEDMREKLEPFRQNLVGSLTEQNKLKEINNMLEEFQSKCEKANHKFMKVRKWLSIVPFFTLTAGALIILKHRNPSEVGLTVVNGGGVGIKIYEEVRRTLRERKYGISAFKEVFRGAVRPGPGTDEEEAYMHAYQMIDELKAYSIARKIILG